MLTFHTLCEIYFLFLSSLKQTNWVRGTKTRSRECQGGSGNCASHIPKQWLSTVTQDDASYTTYGGKYGSDYGPENIAIGAPSFWISQTFTGPRGVTITFNRRVAITNFIFEAGRNNPDVKQRYRGVGLLADDIKVAEIPPSDLGFTLLSFSCKFSYF